MSDADGPLAHGKMFRHSVPIRLSAYWLLAAGAVFVSGVGLYPVPKLPIVLLTVIETAVLGLIYRAAQASPTTALAATCKKLCTRSP